MPDEIEKYIPRLPENQKTDFHIDIDPETQKELTSLGIRMELDLDRKKLKFFSPNSDAVISGQEIINLTGLQIRFDKERSSTTVTGYFIQTMKLVY